MFGLGRQTKGRLWSDSLKGNQLRNSKFVHGLRIRVWQFFLSLFEGGESVVSLVHVFIFPMIRLGVNIDHVATLRQARYREMPDSPNAEPDPVAAALTAERAGAEGITAHLRLDRRHVVDRDIYSLRRQISTKLNLEMGCSDEILKIALNVLPHDVCLVPENRQEVTTEGGLDCAGQKKILAPVIGRLQDAGIVVSLFIDPEEPQIAAASALGAEIVELHTGAYANRVGAERDAELARLKTGAGLAHAAGMQVNAGHGLNYDNLPPILAMPHLVELNIGHSLVARAVSIGIESAVREMVRIIGAGPDGAGQK
jgi:pyridoxine 5-phosphate synthase